MLTHFLSALALVFVLEGLMPFASPNRWRALLLKIIRSDDRALRIAGLLSMLAGLLMLTVIRQFTD